MRLMGELQAIRKLAGVTQSALAERSGLARETVSKMETGSADPQLSSVFEYCRALDLELLVVPKSLLPELKGFIASGGKYFSQPHGIDAPESVVDKLMQR
ncbi:helix-turn-helix transcriptional regulator [Roseateles sp. LYH14W]|uniref:Helix-turn-helix transcriptional regulator n=1 Tax=Pelomonas parva TaxID=3299032 RepID=A0ABW7FB55_9BURK